MTSEYYLELAVRLCCADLNSEFISLQPVLGPRDELLDQRLTWYCEQLERIDAGLKQGNKGSSTLFALAVEFTCADIESGAIRALDKNTKTFVSLADNPEVFFE